MIRTLFVCLPHVSPRTVAAVTIALLAGCAPSLGLAAEPLVAEGGAWSDRAMGDWGGVRRTLLDRGITIDAQLTADASRNLAGGVRRGTATRVPLQLDLSFDPASTLGWQGARLHARFQLHRGRHGSEVLVGDVHGFDNIDAQRFRQVSELWLEQSLFGERLQVKLGKMDANSDFAAVENAGSFINSSAGFSPTIQGFPTYPDPAGGVGVFVRSESGPYSGIGVYDGATNEGSHGRTGNRGIGTFFGEPDALFLIGEAGLRWGSPAGLVGRVGGGLWRHTGTFTSVADGDVRAASGAYVVVEQILRRERGSEEQALAAFAQLGWADSTLSEIVDRHVAVGLAWTGVLPGRDGDVLGAMVSTIRISAGERGGSRARETAVEAFYKIRVRPCLGVHADLQYILDPGAAAARDALVATVRAQVAF